MLTKAPSSTLQELVAHREDVIQYIRKGMLDQGVDKLKAAEAVACINFFRFEDTENLYRCINSGWDEKVIKAIVAHDFNGLRHFQEGFVPKSSQFGVRNG